jgi:hypothetical protein
MSWIALGDGRRCIQAPNETEQHDLQLITTGSIVIETLFTAEQNVPQVVLDMRRNAEWRRQFRVTMRASGEVLVTHCQNQESTHARLQARQPDSDSAMRLTYAWNAPGRRGVLTVENLDSGWMDQVVFDDPQPWPADDVAALVAGAADCVNDPSVNLIAVSDEIEPVGLAPGFVAGTRVATAAGHRRVEDLTPGDLVETAQHGLQPVRHVVRREVPALGRFTPIRLRAPFFGLDRDLNVAPEHRILIAGADAEYLFGADSVLVEARHLAHIAAAPRRNMANTVEYVQVVLDRHDCLSVAGAWGESLYLGDLADHPTRLATSVLAHVPAQSLPRHTEIASPLLKTYEAVVLVSAMCA